MGSSASTRTASASSAPPCSTCATARSCARSACRPGTTEETSRCPESGGGRSGARHRTLYTALYMAATRTQVYLTAAQRERLDELAKRDGRSLASHIREAL